MDQPEDPFASLAGEMLSLEQLDETTFRSEHSHDNTRGTIFGGQFLAQALLAAQRTVSGWPANSASAYFLRPGGFDAPIDYEVERVRDGRSFANRRVVARQSGKAIFDMLCSFHAAEPGPAHQEADVAGVPDADDVPDLKDFLRAHADQLPKEEVKIYLGPLPVQFRFVDPGRTFHLHGEPQARRDVWLRFPAAARIGDEALHQALLAFLSDFLIGTVANDPHSPPFPRQVPVSTLSHGMTFHRSARVDEWMLYRIDSPYAGEGIGFTRGLMFDWERRLVASFDQEVVMRWGQDRAEG